MLLLSFSFFLFVSLLIYAIIAFPAVKKAHLQKRIDTYLITIPEQEMEEEEASGFTDRIIKPFWKRMKKGYQKRLNKEKATQLEVRLLQAGQPFGFNAVEFKLLQISLAVILPMMVGITLFAIHASSMIKVLGIFAALILGILLPGLFLKKKAQKRMDAGLKDLPDMLDMLTISLEAGLGFDAAVSKVVSKKAGVLADEFKVCLEEIRLGRTRKQALTNLSLRLPLEEVKALTYNIIQAEKLGIGMVSVLKVQTEDIREQRKQKAEEKAMKAPIKMLFPLVIFIFPTLFIVLLGPAILQFMDSM
ncbi:type II secretion system F family protein [Virgibacillus senegalensis]|uniref:type II secretion system F family protein n=1 Tax=Virgibacillus senegalensis TaxID=1499679 RepID=UPI00069F5A33|nr:type II secretion system F family protein [Virgibacillus senegalensis]